MKQTLLDLLIAAFLIVGVHLMIDSREPDASFAVGFLGGTLIACAVALLRRGRGA